MKKVQRSNKISVDDIIEIMWFLVIPVLGLILLFLFC